MVLDASAVLDALLTRPLGASVRTHLQDPDVSLVAPSVLALEVVRVIRRLELAGEISPPRARRTLVNFLDVRVTPYRVEPLLRRVWELRHNFTVDDATYVALAETAGHALLTTDRRLARAVRAHTRVALIDV